MPRTCSICAHEDRAEIESALVGGTPYRKIAERFSLSQAALSRHKSGHLPEKLTKAKDAEEAAEADALLSQIRQLQETTLRILRRAEREGDHRTALKAVSQARRNVGMLGELAGELQRQGTVSVEVDTLQAVVLGALEGRPEAKADVARALYESGAEEEE